MAPEVLVDAFNPLGDYEPPPSRLSVGVIEKRKNTIKVQLNLRALPDTAVFERIEVKCFV
jgi:hypothetical protein